MRFLTAVKMVCVLGAAVSGSKGKGGTMKKVSRERWVRWLGVILVLGMSCAAQGALIGVQKNGNVPDIYVGLIDIAYNATTDAFTAGGIAGSVDFGSDPQGITNGTYSIAITVDENGVPGSGVLTIGGTVGSYASGTLLVGSLVDFGFKAGGNDIFDFLFTPTGGDLQSAFSPQVGVILTAGSTAFADDFTVSFSSSSGNGSSDNFRVPEPATLALVGIGFAGLAARRRRARR